MEKGEEKPRALILDVSGAEVLVDDLPAHFLEPRLDGLGLLADWGVETRRLGREELEARVGRGLYVAGAAWDEGNMVHAMRRFGGQTIGWRFGDG